MSSCEHFESGRGLWKTMPETFLQSRAHDEALIASFREDPE